MSFIKYLRETRAELAHVKWPTRTETIQYTGLVLAISVGVALFLGGIDVGLTRLIENLVG